MLCVDHHIAHACAAWCFRTDESERTFLSYDGGGLDERRLYHHSTKGIISADKLEVTAFDTIPSSNPLGRPFGIFNVGKLMGLAGSRPNAKSFSDPDNLLELIGQGKRFTDHQPDLCAGYYRYHIEKIWEAVEQELVGSQGVVIAGGATLSARDQFTYPQENTRRRGVWPVDRRFWGLPSAMPRMHTSRTQANGLRGCCPLRSTDR